MQMGTQPGVAGALFVGAAAAQGFPQRFVYFPTDNPIVLGLSTEPRRHQPLQPLDVAMWPHSEHGAKPVDITYSADMEREILVQHQSRFTGMDDPLDGHRGNLKLRTAALFALAGGSTTVTDLEWNLAAQVETSSRTCRRHLVHSIGNLSAEKARAAGELDAVRNEGRDARWAKGKAERIANWIHGNPPTDIGYTRKQLKGRLSGNEAKQLDAVLEVARSYGWVTHRDGHYYPGPSRPSS
jgi:hypothetical protein